MSFPSLKDQQPPLHLSNFYKHAQKKKNITGVHLETKQMHWYILGSVSASLFQLKQLRVTFEYSTRLKPGLWNRGVMCFSFILDTRGHPRT